MIGEKARTATKHVHRAKSGLASCQISPPNVIAVRQSQWPIDEGKGRHSLLIGFNISSGPG